MDKAGDLLKNLSIFKNIDSGSAEKYTAVFKSWEKIAGLKLADYSRIVDLNHKTLVVEVDHPGIMQLLQMKYSEILRRLRHHYPQLEIADIRMFVKNPDFQYGKAGIGENSLPGDKDGLAEDDKGEGHIENIDNPEFRDLLLNMKKRSQV